MDTVEKLNQLSEWRSSVNEIYAEKQVLIESLYTPELKQKIHEIEDEFKPKAESMNGNIANLETSIKADVILVGETAQGDSLEAVFTSGRVSWDTKGLDEAIKVLPQLEQYKKKGDPYVTIRARR
jgi:phage host-nuclease inhibitor protein Gam